MDIALASGSVVLDDIIHRARACGAVRADRLDARVASYALAVLAGKNAP